MCIVSNIGGNFTNQFPHRPYYPTQPINPKDNNKRTWDYIDRISESERETSDIAGIVKTIKLNGDEDKLRKDIESLKKLLIAAVEYDKQTGQPDCHIDAKTILIKTLAEELDIDMTGIFD